jgi:hypothetical protein
MNNLESYKSPLIIPHSIVVKSSLVPLRLCSVAFGIGEDEIMEMIEDGRLRWAFDLRRKNSRKAFVFVLVDSLQKAQDNAIDTLSFSNNEDDEWNRVIEIILPHKKPLIKGSEIVKAFSISSQHMMNLVNDRLLVALNSKRRRTATPIITRDSVLKFLKERRII